MSDIRLLALTVLLLASCQAESPSETSDAVNDKLSTENNDVPAVSEPAEFLKEIGDEPVQEFRDSEFRPGTKVYFVFNEDLGDPYTTSWWGALSKRNGDGVEVYYETNEKLTDNGIVSFSCSGESEISVLSYGNEWANADNKTLYIISPSMLRGWKDGTLSSEESPQMSFEVFENIKQKFCS